LALERYEDDAFGVIVLLRTLADRGELGGLSEHIVRRAADLLEAVEKEKQEWVCLECGTMNKSHTATTGGGDYDIVCDECGSTEVEEGYAIAFRTLVLRIDTLRGSLECSTGGGQSRKYSLLEIVISTAVGFVLAFLANLIIIAPVMGRAPSLGENLVLTIFFTFISIGRGYFMRRLFNRLHVKGIL
jgi:hypothetical protein